MVKADRLSSVARGIALFIGLFAQLNVLAAFRHAAFDGNEWWIDLRALPIIVSRTTIAALATLLAAWAKVKRLVLVRIFVSPAGRYHVPPWLPSIPSSSGLVFLIGFALRPVKGA